jgi:hypothetical protein
MSRKNEDDDLLQLRHKNYVHNFATEIGNKVLVKFRAGLVK